MKKKIIGIFVCILLIGITIQTVSSVKTETNITQIQIGFYDRIIERLMDFGHFPSVSACIIKNGQVVWSDGYGYRDIENNSYADDNTIYEVASITKTVTGTALMQLYDQGLFDLDDDINDYLPFSLRNPNYPDEPITFRMLLSHASSIAYTYYWEYSPPLEDYDTWFPDIFIEEYLVPGGEYYNAEAWANDYGPGEKNSYANMNFVIISYLVELISFQHFVEYCNENIFESLEMWNTSFYFEDLNKEQVAIPYMWNASEGTHDSALFYYPEWFIPGCFFPEGGLFTSVLDLSHLMIAHMNGGVYNEARILKEDTIEEMHRIQPPGSKYYGYGLAWLHYPRNYIIGLRGFIGPRLIYQGHLGDMAGIHTFMFKKASKDVAVIFFINTDRMSNNRIWNAAGLLAEILFLKSNHY